MLIGYARVSTMDQNPALQMDALRAAGCEKIFTEKASGSHRDRPELRAALEYLREGDIGGVEREMVVDFSVQMTVLACQNNGP